MRSENIPSQLFTALQAGIVGGFISSFVKWGTEIPLPPRTADRVSPPVQMLLDVGIDPTHWDYAYSGHLIMWAPAIIHTLFSLFFAIGYCLLAIKIPRITLWHGLAFGVAITLLFHGLILPFFHWAPAMWNLPADELISESFGHLMWAWTIEIVRRQFIDSALLKKNL